MVSEGVVVVAVVVGTVDALFVVSLLLLPLLFVGCCYCCYC